MTVSSPFNSSFPRLRLPKASCICPWLQWLKLAALCPCRNGSYVASLCPVWYYQTIGQAKERDTDAAYNSLWPLTAVW